MVRNSSLIALKHVTNRAPNNPCIHTTYPFHTRNHHLINTIHSPISTPPPPLLPPLPPAIPRSNICIQPHTFRQRLTLIPVTTQITSASAPPTTSPPTSTPSPRTSLLQVPLLNTQIFHTTKVRVRAKISIHSLHPPHSPIRQADFNSPWMITPRQYLTDSTADCAASRLVFFQDDVNACAWADLLGCGWHCLFIYVGESYGCW
ncbi:hypothetical protein BO85DRAFT_139722 [Aspergillus piperis CBS 112811]|uniref:Uncharacterized protein n=1 Tax=Aspergillus piperis CBS 112811 TaxID=1448313 RepID=A0A8G1QW73_9EURO|nr:hypothetical protein BO85DRAFT_139722 [Aspergillus piperis CBS 112811]RAH54136.1 hypothetical protein BO85DRAFT_139722 [Aspergillus piperis CBS 112811]